MPPRRLGSTNLAKSGGEPSDVATGGESEKTPKAETCPIDLSGSVSTPLPLTRADRVRAFAQRLLETLPAPSHARELVIALLGELDGAEVSTGQALLA